MERERLEQFLDAKVRVDLVGGVTLVGTLQASVVPQMLEVLSRKGTHQLMWPSQVVEVTPLTPSEVYRLEKQCTCSDTGDLALDQENHLKCPLHSFKTTELDHDAYEEWKGVLYGALRENAEIQAKAGKPLDRYGEYEMAGFQVDAADKPAGDEGAVRITVVIKRGPAQGRPSPVMANWRKDDAVTVARTAARAYLDRLRRFGE